MRVLGTLSLDQVLSAAEAIEDSHPSIADELDRRIAAGEITHREYLIGLGGFCLTLAVYDEEQTHG